MSVTITEIHTNDFQEPDELTENNHPLSATQQCSHIIGQKGDTLQRIPKAWFYGPGLYPNRLSYGSSSVVVSSNGDQVHTSTREIRTDSVGATTFKIGGVVKMILNAAFNNIRVYTHLQTWAPGTSLYMYADGFVEWSMARIKDNIRPIPPTTGAKPIIPRIYTQQGRNRLGFVVEESPAEIVETTVDEDGKEHSGIDIMALCALQQAKINDLEVRLKKLEARSYANSRNR